MPLMTVTEHIRAHLLERCGIIDRPKQTIPKLEKLMESEWSVEFERMMRNRLIMGRFRYGPLHKKNGSKPVYNKIDSIRQRLDLYELEGNAEYLVDIANLCLVEFVDESHPNFHFNSIDDGVHAGEIPRL